MDTTLKNRVSAFRGTAVQVRQQCIYEEQNLARLRAKISQIEIDKAQLVMAIGLIDRATQIISANGIGKIESVVSGGLQMVFNDKSIGLILNKKEGARGSSYELLLRQSDFVGKPTESFGGGVQNIVAFLLRVVMIKRFRLAKFLALDESFNNVSANHLPMVSEMLKRLCHDHGFTILAVTHQPVLAASADRMYRVTDEDCPRIVSEIQMEGTA